MLKKTTHFLILLCFLALSIPAHAVGLTIDKTRTINMVTVTQDANTGDYTIVKCAACRSRRERRLAHG